MREVNPSETTRAYAFEMWMQAPVPMVTFFKALDVTRLVRVGKMRGLKFNMLMCWCVGKAASDIKEERLVRATFLSHWISGCLMMTIYD